MVEAITEVVPRIDSSRRLQNFISQKIKIIGKLIQQKGNDILLESFDKGQIHVRLNQSQYAVGSILEVVGVVGEDLSIQELASLQLSDGFDLEMFQKLMNLYPKYAQVFNYY